MTYLEQRRHELRKRRIQMIDGSLTVNSQTVDAGASARVFANCYWGFASAPDTDAASLGRIADAARRNAGAMARFGPRTMPALAEGTGQGEHVYHGLPALG
ncbi:MAG: DNA gyrase modulator, partial [Caldimonas sp.]